MPAALFFTWFEEIEYGTLSNGPMRFSSRVMCFPLPSYRRIMNDAILMARHARWTANAAYLPYMSPATGKSAEESTHTIAAVSYTHLTLPTIYSV